MFGLNTIQSDIAKVLPHIRQAEKKCFPRSEVLDFDVELKKRNTELVVALDDCRHAEHTKDHLLVGYMLIARTQRTALLHKICVLEEYRHRGIAKAMLLKLKSKLSSRGCDDIQLWVDESREPARALYNGIGFEEVDRVEDYYSPRRAGIKMILRPQSP